MSKSKKKTAKPDFGSSSEGSTSGSTHEDIVLGRSPEGRGVMTHEDRMLDRPSQGSAPLSHSDIVLGRSSQGGGAMTYDDMMH